MGSSLHTCSYQNIISWGYHCILVAIKISMHMYVNQYIFSSGHHYIRVVGKLLTKTRS